MNLSVRIFPMRYSWDWVGEVWPLCRTWEERTSEHNLESGYHEYNRIEGHCSGWPYGGYTVSAYPPQPSRCCDKWPVAHYCEVREAWKDEEGPCLPHKPPGDCGPGLEIECAISDLERSVRDIDSTGMLRAHLPILARAASVRPKVTTMGWSDFAHEWYEVLDPTRCCLKWPRSHYCNMREAWSCDDVVRLPHELPGHYCVGSDIDSAILALRDETSEISDQSPDLDAAIQHTGVQSHAKTLPTSSPRPYPRNTSDADINKSLRWFRLGLRQRYRHHTTSTTQAKRPLDSLPLELYFHIRSCLNPEDQISLGLAGQNFYPRLDPANEYRRLGLMYPPNVRIHGVRIEKLARKWSTSRKGIAWMEPFTEERHYCCAEKVESGYIVYLHTLPYLNF